MMSTFYAAEKATIDCSLYHRAHSTYMEVGVVTVHNGA